MRLPTRRIDAGLLSLAGALGRNLSRSRPERAIDGLDDLVGGDPGLGAQAIAGGPAAWVVADDADA